MGSVLFVACTNVGRAMIEAVQNSPLLKEVRIAGVVNLKPVAAIGKANYDPYTDLFEKYGLDHYYCSSVNEPQCMEFMKACAPDIIIQSGWSGKFSEEVLQIPRYACIGEHPAPLPKGRGAACINWAIITGERQWGDTFLRMEMEYDTGLIYSQELFDIELYDDVKTVYDKVAAASVRAVEKHLSDWTKGILAGYSQDDAAATYYSKRIPDDGIFDFSRDTAINIYNHIRGQARPYSGAFFEYTGSGGAKRIYVWSSRLGDHVRGGETKVRCGDDNYVILQRVQQEGRPEMWAADYFGTDCIEF